MTEPKLPHLRKLKRLKPYIAKRKNPWTVIVYDPESDRRAVGMILGETLKRFLEGGKPRSAPLIVTHRAWEQLKSDGKL